MADQKLNIRVEIDADVAGKDQVDGLKQSVDALGAEGKQAFGELSDAQKQAKSTTDSLANSFKTLGLRSAREIEADILEVNQALQRLARDSTLTGQQFDRAFAAGQERLAKLRGELAGTGEAFGAVGQKAGALIALMAPLAAAFSGLELARQFLAANVELERMERTFAAITGSSQAAAAEMAYAREVADRLALPVITAGKAYADLMASTRGTAVEGQATRAVFESVARAMSFAGKTADDTQGALLALSQIASKGVVSMEELRGQLGERLPGALNAAANGFGITTAQLIKLTETGSLTAEQLFPALASGLDSLYGASAKAGQAANTLEQRWTGVKNAVENLFKTLGDAGVIATFKASLETLEAILVGISIALEKTGQKIGIFFAALKQGDIGLRGFSQQAREAFAEVDRAAAEKLGSAAGHNRLLAAALARVEAAGQGAARGSVQAGEAAQQAGQSAAAATGAIVRLNVLYAELAQAGKDSTDQAEKNAAARKAEGDAAIALAGALGTESQQQQANSEAKRATADALRQLAVERQADLTQSERHLASLRAEIATRGQASEQEQKQIEALKQLIEARRSEADAAIAGAQSAAVAAAAAETAALAAADNSARVNELAAAYAAATAKRAELEAQKLAGVEVSGQLSDAQIEEAQAAALYRDAVADVTSALERQAAVKQGQLSLDQALIRLAIEQQRTAFDVARARGDERGAIAAVLELKRLEIRQAELLASAKKAEAAAALAAVQAKRAELQAAGLLTEAKEAELQALEAAANVKVVEAQIAAETAKRIRELSEAARDSGNAAGTMAAGFRQSTAEVEQFGNAVERTTDKVRGLRVEGGKPLRLEGEFSGSVGKGGLLGGSVNLRDKGPIPTVKELQDKGLSQGQIQEYYELNDATTEADKARGDVKRYTRSEKVDAAFIARNAGFKNEDVAQFEKLFFENLSQEMADRWNTLHRRNIGTQSYLASYYGSFQRAIDRTRDEVNRQNRVEADQTGRSQAATTLHRVEISFAGKTTAVDTASPAAAKALLDVLTDLNTRAVA